MKRLLIVPVFLLFVSFVVALPFGENVQKKAVGDVKNEQIVGTKDDNTDRSKRHLGLGGIGLLKLKTIGVLGGIGAAKAIGYKYGGGYGGYGGYYDHGSYGGGYYGHGGYDDDSYAQEYPYYKKSIISYSHPHEYSYHPYGGYGGYSVYEPHGSYEYPSHSYGHSNGYGGSYGYPTGSYSSASAYASSSSGSSGGCGY